MKMQRRQFLVRHTPANPASFVGHFSDIKVVRLTRICYSCGMKATFDSGRIFLGAVLILLAAKLPAATTSGSYDYPFKPVPFTAVHLDDVFWAPRLATNRITTIPYAFDKCRESGRMYNFERAAAVLRGASVADRTPPGYPFDDTDPYKVLEGASYSLAVQPDPAMSAYLDKLIALFASAQEPDGYLYTT